MNIILIGMPASGKSTAGVLLAKTLGYGFIDSDLLIQNREKALLCDIIAAKGAGGIPAHRRGRERAAVGGAVRYRDGRERRVRPSAPCGT